MSNFDNVLLSDSLESIEFLPNSTIVKSKETLGLCVLIQGTTTSTVDHKHEIDDLIRIYGDLGMNDRHVFYFMDKKKNPEIDPEEFCKIRNIRCVFVEYPNDKFSYREKTFAMFAYVQETKLYEQCDFMMKLDSDAYVDIPAYSAFLHYRFNASDNHYSGQIMSCADYLFVQGTYILSRGVFANDNGLNFTRDKDLDVPGCGSYDDVVMSVYLTVYKNLNMINTRRHTLGFAAEDKLRVRWDDYIGKGKDDCLFVCHRCSNSFREEFAIAHRSIEMAGNESCYLGEYTETRNKNLEERKADEEKKRAEEKKKVEEEKKRVEKEKKLVEEEKKHIEEEKKKIEEEKQKFEKEKKKAEDEKKKVEDEKKKVEDEKRKEEDEKRKEEDEKKKADEKAESETPNDDDKKNIEHDDSQSVRKTSGNKAKDNSRNLSFKVHRRLGRHRK